MHCRGSRPCYAWDNKPLPDLGCSGVGFLFSPTAARILESFTAGMVIL